MALPRGVALTVEDVWEIPDDGHRDELEGMLIVTPAPGTPFPVRVVPSQLRRGL